MVAFAEYQKISFSQSLKAKAKAIALKAALKFDSLNTEQIQKLKSALILGIEYGNQAKFDEGNGDELAHQKAAYEWGYDVGDPKIVKMIRFYWEGVQLGVFAIGDAQQRSGEKNKTWAQIESMVGGNGKEYDIDKAYIDDIFNDIQITVDGANDYKAGLPKDFTTYWKKLDSGD